MNRLLLLLPVLLITSPVAAEELSREAMNLIFRLETARAWTAHVAILKPIAEARQKASYAAPALRRYIKDTKGRTCGSGIAHYYAVMALASVENGNDGLQTYVDSAKKTGITNPARVFAVKLIDEKGFVPLFDGTSLKGWEGKESVFRVQDKAETSNRKSPTTNFSVPKRRIRISNCGSRQSSSARGKTPASSSARNGFPITTKSSAIRLTLAFQEQTTRSGELSMMSPAGGSSLRRAIRNR